MVEAVRTRGLDAAATAGLDTGEDAGGMGCGGRVAVEDRESSMGVEEDGQGVPVGVEALLRLLRLRVERVSEDENLLDARFVPLGGGVHVRLIFSNGTELSESDEEE